MERNIEFNLQDNINIWFDQLKSSPALTEFDSEELKNHLLDSIDELKDTGLDDDEAFWVATKRLGSSCDCEKDFEQVNSPIFQMRKSLMVFAGVLVYYLLYYIILSTSKLLFIILLLAGKDGYVAVGWISHYVISIHFLFVLFATSIYFLENKIISFLENINIKPKRSILLLAITIILGIINTCLRPITKNVMGHDRVLSSHLSEVFLYFNYSFPLIICVAFVVLYFKYYKKVKL